MIQRRIFAPADILLPKQADMKLWSTVACDQFTSDTKYWDAVAQATDGKLSTMHMIFPEAYLQIKNHADETQRINAVMESYLNEDVFYTLRDSYIYVERTLPSGVIRHGLVGAIDLSQYDYQEGSVTPVRATEHTVESRLPARVEIRKNAPIEMPHIMLFIDDRDDMIMRSAAASAGEPVYNFDLMCNGGHICGRPISGTNADFLTAMLDELTDETLLENKYGFSYGAIIYAIGDGNHSLAAAKKCWEEIRKTLSDEEQQNHPARYALVELMNIHDEGVAFHPIHRAVFGIDSNQFEETANAELFSEEGTAVTLVTPNGVSRRFVKADSIGMVIERVDRFCQEFAQNNGGEVDYIHGDAETINYGSSPNNAAILLPTMKKEELFTSVMETGVFCKKSFSIGEAHEKRYYLECRNIRN